MKFTFKLKSHPNKSLFEHLKNVGEASRREVLSKQLNLTLIDKEQLSNIAYLIGVTHDFGKALKGFQEYLSGKTSNGPRHSPVSSILTFQLVKEYCTNARLPKIFALISYYCVRKHHGDLNGIDEEVKELQILESQIKELKSNKEVKEMYSILLKDFFNPEIIEKLSTKIIKEDPDEKEVISFLGKLPKESSIELFLVSEYLYSLLTDLDKQDAAGILNLKDKEKPAEFSQEIVEKYLDYMRKNDKSFDPEKPINKIKNEFYSKVISENNSKKEQKIYTITAPTGIGKTLTSLALAMKIRANISQNYKIIYILPFTTIIDQNYEVFCKVLNMNFKDFNDKRELYILKHHYLSEEKQIDEKKLKFKEQEYLDYLFKIKSWKSNIIISTYIQLMYSLLGNKQSFLNKFHNIINSIIILDEVQFIKNKYWKLTNKLISILAEKFNIYFILMTATQPKIFSQKESVQIDFEKPEVLKNSKKIIYERENKNIDSFLDEIIEDVSTKKPRRVIIVMNTKKSSKELFKKLKGRLNSFAENYLLFYLSKSLTAKDIKERVKHINDMFKSDQKYILITTQLIEAGVDISADILYRDFAVLPSLIQSAGRCNRFNESPLGIVKFVNLVDKEGEPYYSIYPYEYIKYSKEILEKNQTFEERKILDEFFEKIKEDKNADNLFEAIKWLEFQKVGTLFKLIDENKYEESVFFEEDEQAEALLKEYIKQKEEFSKSRDFKKLNKIKMIRRRMEIYMVGVPKKELSELKASGKIIEEKKSSVFYIPKENIQQIYDKEVGYNFEPEKTTHEII